MPNAGQGQPTPGMGEGGEPVLEVGGGKNTRAAVQFKNILFIVSKTGAQLRAEPPGEEASDPSSLTPPPLSWGKSPWDWGDSV